MAKAKTKNVNFNVRIRALAADPPVLLMDERFGAIDPINRAVIEDGNLEQYSASDDLLAASQMISSPVFWGRTVL